MTSVRTVSPTRVKTTLRSVPRHPAERSDSRGPETTETIKVSLTKYSTLPDSPSMVTRVSRFCDFAQNDKADGVVDSASREACVPHFVRQPLPWFRDSAQAHSPLNLRRGAAEPARATRSAPLNDIAG